MGDLFVVVVVMHQLENEQWGFKPMIVANTGVYCLQSASMATSFFVLFVGLLMAQNSMTSLSMTLYMNTGVYCPQSVLAP
jgi:hypothetical protein